MSTKKAESIPGWINNIGAAVHALIREPNARARFEEALDDYTKVRRAELANWRKRGAQTDQWPSGLLPLSRNRQLSLTEKYALLAIVYDYTHKGTEKVSQGDWPKDYKPLTVVQSVIDELRKLPPDHEPWLKTALDDVEKDLERRGGQTNDKNGAKTITAAEPSDFMFMRIPFFRGTFEGNELTYLSEVLASGWLTSGAKVEEFEHRFARMVGARYALAVSSGTAALHLALEAIGGGTGEGVFVPTLTFTATAEVMRYVGAVPIFLDVEYGSCLLTPSILRAAIEAHPEVHHLIVVHYGGCPAEMRAEQGEGILDLCRGHGIHVIEDAAHAFGARQGGRMVGSGGEATCFSFYANKCVTSGEGGMLTTDDPAIADRARLLRLHGIEQDAWHRDSAEQQWEYDVVAPGFKYNMSDIHAAVGLAQLERAEEFQRHRRYGALRYYEYLSDVDCLDLPPRRIPAEDHAWHLFPVILNEKARISRDDLVHRLARRGIQTSVHFKPLHRMTYYRETYGLDPSDFPSAERIWRGSLSLPLFPSMTPQEQNYVCECIKDIVFSEE